MIRIKLFAAAKQIVGSDELQLDVVTPLSVSHLRNKLVEREPKLAEVVAHARFAVNAEYATDETQVDADDDIAIIPPVSGG